MMQDPTFKVGERYTVLRVLGKGSYGVVCSAVDTKSSSMNRAQEVQIAIKKITNIFKRDVLMKRALRELKLMKFFNGHKNIISLINLEFHTNSPYDGLYCFQELAEYDLAKVIYSSTQLSEFHIQSFTYQILCGLKYIHSAEVIHRDLKPGNILVTAQGTLKICDFGLARGINRSAANPGGLPITNYVATRWYRAPELLFGCKKYEKPVDIWAVGCILAELHGRKPLFIGNNQINQIQQILKVLGSPPPEIIFDNKWNLGLLSKAKYRPAEFASLYPFASSEAIELITKLLRWNPFGRLTVKQSLQHPFFIAVRDEEAEPECASVFDFGFEDECQNSQNPLRALQVLLDSEVEEFKQGKSG